MLTAEMLPLSCVKSAVAFPAAFFTLRSPVPVMSPATVVCVPLKTKDAAVMPLLMEMLSALSISKLPVMLTVSVIVTSCELPLMVRFPSSFAATVPYTKSFLLLTSTSEPFRMLMVPPISLASLPRLIEPPSALRFVSPADLISPAASMMPLESIVKFSEAAISPEPVTRTPAVSPAL